MSLLEIKFDREMPRTIISEAALALGILKGKWQILERLLPIYMLVKTVEPPSDSENQTEEDTPRQIHPIPRSEIERTEHEILRIFAFSDVGLRVEDLIKAIDKLEKKGQKTLGQSGVAKSPEGDVDSEHTSDEEMSYPIWNS